MDVFELAAKITLDSSEYESGLQAASEKTGSFGSGLGGKLGAAAKVGAAAVAAVGTAVVAAGGAMVAATKSAAAYGDAIDKNSQKMGVSAQWYQEWDQVLQHSGTSMESMKPAMKSLVNAADSGNDAFARLGLSMSDVSNMSQEQLFDATISALQNCTDATERQAIANDLMGRSAMELGPLLNTSARSVEEMKQRAHELGGIMSDAAIEGAYKFTDAMQDMNFAITGVKNGIAENLLPSLSQVMIGLADVISGHDIEGGLNNIQQGVSDTVNTIVSQLPGVIERVGQIGVALGSALIENLPAIGEAGISMIQTLGEGITTGLPILMEQLPGMVTGIADFIGENLPALAETGADIIVGIAEGISTALPALIEAAPQILMSIGEGIIGAVGVLYEHGPAIISAIAEGVVGAAGALLEAGSTLINNIGAGIASRAGELATNIGAAIQSAVDSAQSAISGFISTGAAIIGNIVSGILTRIGEIATNIQNAINNAIAAAIAAASGFIESGREAIAKIVEGIKNKADDVSNAIKDAIQNAKAKAEEKIESFKDVGRRIIEGIASGVRGAVDTLTGAIGSVVSRALAAAKSALGIASPSKVFRDEVGLFIGEGIAVGIDRSTRAVEGSLERLKSLATESSSNLFSNLGSVDFASSGLGVSSAGMINGFMSAAQGNSGGSYTLNLVTADGNQMAQWIFDPLKDHAAAKGTPILAV